MTWPSFVLGSPDRPMRVAIVGAGPSGCYAAEALFTHTALHIEVDLYDRLPTPYGLVRGGVAPDHQNVKAVARVFEKILARPEVRLFGNVSVGQAIPIELLRRHYDAIVLAFGAEADRRLGIPGEDLRGSQSATEFVGWYNAHPDFVDRSFDLGCDRAAVIGVGNVAVDVARILVKDPEELATSDISTNAVDTLRSSRIREVVLLGRRGPAQAAFTPREIRSLGQLESADLVVDQADLDLDEVSQEALAQPAARQIMDYLRVQATLGAGTRPRKVKLRFFAAPTEILGEAGRVRAVRFERTRLRRGPRGEPVAEGTGRFEELPVGLVLRSVGYMGLAMKGVPFDARRGIVPNEDGRVVDPIVGTPVDGLYVVGWAKRGPSGLIGANRADSIAVVRLLVADAVQRMAPRDANKTAAASLHAVAGLKPDLTTFRDWTILNGLEMERGTERGKIREKVPTVDEMLRAIDTAEPDGGSPSRKASGDPR